MSRRIAVVFTSVAVLVFSFIISSCTAFFSANQASYTLGITGTATTVTVTGASPEQKASALFEIDKYASYFYSATEARTEPIVCEYDQGGYHFVVRDSGGPNSLRHSLCAFLADLQAGKISSSSGGPGSPGWALTYASSNKSANATQTPTATPGNGPTITPEVTSTTAAASATVTPNKWESERKLFPVWQTGRLGFINSGGEIQITPQFDQWGAPPMGVSQNEPWLYFSEGLCAVSIGGRVGFIDETGRMVINPEYDAAFPFSDGFALVFTAAGKCFIDNTGRRLNVEGFADANPFVDGLARVYSKSGQVGWIDTAGMMIGGRYFDDSSAVVSEGVIAVAEDGKWGYIDTEGKAISPMQFDFANDVSE
ncbi:MAG: WG repeat-containing protein, partial [Candidatus Marsarchaeota archaeon]|nr:WG repeat-containing protein [Candidatus Marsarchaeota archaeon]